MTQTLTQAMITDSDPIKIVRIYECLPSASAYQVEQHVIDADILAQKGVVLEKTPYRPSRTLLFIDGAGATFLGVDFNVIGNVISWNGMRLDGLLELNDRIQIIYF